MVFLQRGGKGMPLLLWLLGVPLTVILLLHALGSDPLLVVGCSRFSVHSDKRPCAR
jgi:hypothetical protein